MRRKRIETCFSLICDDYHCCFYYCFSSECQNYYSLNSGSGNRKITYTIRQLKCDSGMTHGWYRFEGAAGKQMASSCPPTNRSGTDATGWLRGGHPNVANGQVSKTVCFHWSSNCCRWSTTIHMSCGSFYVYYMAHSIKDKLEAALYAVPEPGPFFPALSIW